MLLLPLYALAQDTENTPTREVGITSSRLMNNFGLVYKKELSENRYRVYSGQFDLNLSFAENSFSSLFTSFSVGTENRKYLNEKIKFVRGPAYGLGLLISGENATSLTPFFNYQLGIQYDINEMIYLGVSSFPTVSLLILPEAETPISFLNVNASFNAQLSVVFRF
jgi:hypothetical protein